MSSDVFGLAVIRPDVDSFTHTQTFGQGVSDDYRETWIFQTRQLLQDAGLVHHFDEDGRDAVFTFRSIGGLAMFDALNQSGYLGNLAAAELTINGPAAVGAIPY